MLFLAESMGIILSIIVPLAILVLIIRGKGTERFIGVGLVIAVASFFTPQLFSDPYATESWILVPAGAFVGISLSLWARWRSKK